jgi:hypothetical protein
MWRFRRNELRRIQFSNSNIVCKYSFAISRRDAPESCMSRSPRKEGVGNAECPLHPQME